MSDVKFPCEKCGECCRHISGIPELAEYDRGDGVCIHLKGVLCEIYDHRPDICNVETMFRKVFSKSMTREEFFAKNLDACKVLMKMNFTVLQLCTRNDASDFPETSSSAIAVRSRPRTS